MTQEKAVAGKATAANGYSANGNGLHPHSTTEAHPVILSDQTKHLLSLIWRGGQWANIWTPNTDRYYIDKKTGERKECKDSIWFPADKMPAVPASWANRNIYFGVYPSTSQGEIWQRTRIATAASMATFFGEYDQKDYGSKEAILAHLESLPLYPSAVIDSGGGFHCYWLLEYPVLLTDENRDYMRRLLYAWVDVIGSDKAAKDISRVLRLPGSYNRKPERGPDFPQVQIIEFDDRRTFPLERIEEIAGHLVSAQQERPEYEHTSTLDDMAAAIDALQRLASWHRDDYADWIKVGMALKAGFGESGLALWREWSAGSAKYEEGACDSKWRSFSPDSITLGSLIYMADQDAPREKKQRKSESASGGQARRDEQAPADSAKDDEGADDRAERALLFEGAHDEGNAQCVHLRYKGRFLHNEAFGWLFHTGSHWTRDGAEAAVERAITETLTARIEAALRSGSADKHGDLIKRCIPNAGRVQGAKKQLESKVYVNPELFDRDPDSLNCPNGLVDLRTGKIAPHSPEQRFTHCTSVPYEYDADDTKWREWLFAAVGDEAAAWLQLAVGYSLTGHISEEVLFYLVGPPRAGKGIFTETLIAMLGKPLAAEINFGTFTAQRTGDSQNFDLAPLKACRLLAASESNSYEKFNEARLKALTGGNEVYCAYKHHDHFSYRPRFAIWLSSNEPVNADPDDDAVWGRLRVVEFPHSHLGQENKQLKAHMRSPEVLKGVLRWAIEGARMWYELGEQGLPELKSSQALKQAERHQLDTVGAWLEECCKRDADSFASNSDLYTSYKYWCERNGQAPKQMKAFTQALKRKALKDEVKWHEGKTRRGFSGVVVI